VALNIGGIRRAPFDSEHTPGLVLAAYREIKQRCFEWIGLAGSDETIYTAS
jgi:hypothetical protein